MQITINGKPYLINDHKTILEVCLENEVEVPHFCYHLDLLPRARCRICIVDVDGRVMAACNTKIREGMNIQTDTEMIINLRKLNLELILAINPSILDNEKSEVSLLAKQLGITKDYIRFDKVPKTLDESSPSLIRDSSLCILCGKCVQKCQDIQGVCAIGFMNRSHQAKITTAFEHNLNDISCVFCGQCSNVCPTGAIKEKEYINQVKEAIADPNKIVIVETAPAVRASLGEIHGMPVGSLVTGKMVAALRKLGFDRVLDTDFTADLTILEEGTEFINRIKNNGVLPMITSCSPGWIKYIEHFYPNLLHHLSTCKSPQQMFGALVKTYYAEKNKLDPKDIICVSIMPCTAKKFEMGREEMKASGYQDVDYVLTTRELGKWISETRIDFAKLPDEDFDRLMGESTGAAVIFGATGGVMEAALRSVVDILENKDLENIEYTQVRGLEHIKEATLKVAGIEVNIAVVHGLKNANKLLEEIQKGNSKYHFIEIMACSGGCIGGGGQPIPTNSEIIKKRAAAIYQEDKRLPLRKSHKNPEVQKLYNDFLIKPGSEKSHNLLHTKYTNRKKYKV